MDLIYPHEKEFVFTIFDDTDVSTIDYIRPIYDQLHQNGLFITKSVWPLSYNGESDYLGSHTLEDQEYALYIKDLSENGFEIAYHGATMVSSTRERTIRALDLFKDVTGQYPRTYASHGQNRENIYWGSSRLTNPFLRHLYALISREKTDYYQGHMEGSKYFWGDLCLKHFDYVRNLTFNEINLLNISDVILYRDLSKPWVKSWFISSDADNVEVFNHLLSDENQQKLQQEQGICILSTHFGKGFIRNGKLHPETARLMKQMSQRNGWFVPVKTVLDFLREQREPSALSFMGDISLELKWFIHVLRRLQRNYSYEKTELLYLNKSYNS